MLMKIGLSNIILQETFSVLILKLVWPNEFLFYFYSFVIVLLVDLLIEFY